MQAIRLQTNHRTNPIGVDFQMPLFTWNCEGGKEQSAYQVQVFDEKETLIWDSDKILSSDMKARYGGRTFKSRDRICWSVRLWDEKEQPGEWSKKAYFELGLLEEKDWKAKWINPELPHSEKERQPASYLKKNFQVTDKMEQARLYITAHGIYDAYLNGKHVDGYYLSPGNCQVPKRLQVQTYDVGTLLKQGENELIVTVGDGWYRGSVAYDMDTNTFGTDVALLAQLEVNGHICMITDESFQASESGSLGKNDHMQGEEYDARKSKINDWHKVTVAQWGYQNLIGTNGPCVTEHERFSPKLLITPAGERVLDFGQVIAGYIEFDLTAHEGDKLILSHGETLDEHGNFTISNFQNPKKPQCYQKVTYICKEGKNQYHPTKCYFGFRYVKVEGKADIDGSEFTAVAVYSDMEQTGWFSCGNDEVNQLFQNALWSMKGNFVDVPTDCPTREKSGYSGDCQVFSYTAMYLMDCYSVLNRWIEEQAATQFEDGCVRQIAPENRARSPWDGGAGWCDSMEIVPWRLAVRYDDTLILEQNYEAIRDWMQFCIIRAKKTRIRNRFLPEQIRDYLVDTGIHWGEWLEPGISGARQMFYMADLFINGAPEVATAYLSYGCRIMSEIAGKLGNKKDQIYFSQIGEKAKTAYRYKFINRNRLQKAKRQCMIVRPLALGLFEDTEKKAAADLLAGKIKENGGHLNTGFLSTHELCRVLTDNGQSEAAYDLLLQEDRPGWLYAVKKGATSMWESWDGMNEDGKVRDSFNHYSYGAVVGWLFDRVCGIVVENGTIRLKPYPDIRLGHAKAEYLSPFGRILSSWEYEGDKIIYSFTVPVNMKAQIQLPGEESQIVGAGMYHYEQKIK